MLPGQSAQDDRLVDPVEPSSRRESLHEDVVGEGRDEDDPTEHLRPEARTRES